MTAAAHYFELHFNALSIEFSSLQDARLYNTESPNSFWVLGSPRRTRVLNFPHPQRSWLNDFRSGCHYIGLKLVSRDISLFFRIYTSPIHRSMTICVIPCRCWLLTFGSVAFKDDSPPYTWQVTVKVVLNLLNWYCFYVEPGPESFLPYYTLVSFSCIVCSAIADFSQLLFLR